MRALFGCVGGVWVCVWMCLSEWVTCVSVVRVGVMVMCVHVRV